MEKLRTKDEATKVFEEIFGHWVEDATPNPEEFAALKTIAWKFFKYGRDMAFEEVRGVLYNTANSFADNQIRSGYY